MTEQITPAQVSAALRQQAEQQLKSGTAALSCAFNASADALAVLYRLSSTANTASDGLKLLHELQTYQVELDIQLEQLQNTEREQSQELACYRQFFTLTAQPCLVVDAEGIISHHNPAAASRLSSTAQSLCGRAVLSLFALKCRPMLNAALARAQHKAQSMVLMLTLADNTAASNTTPVTEPIPATMQLSIHPGPDHNSLLIMLT